jgi:hypothetical protein
LIWKGVKKAVICPIARSPPWNFTQKCIDQNQEKEINFCDWWDKSSIIPGSRLDIRRLPYTLSLIPYPLSLILYPLYAAKLGRGTEEKVTIALICATSDIKIIREGSRSPDGGMGFKTLKFPAKL